MTHIASDMAHLRFEITKGHQARGKLINDLHHFTDDLCAKVSKSLHNVHETREKNSRNAAAKRRAFVIKLQHSVQNFRNDFAMELQNARMGWAGEKKPIKLTSPMRKKPLKKKKK